MPGEQDKQVKLSFIVDQSSVQKAKQAMNDLISTAQRLAETLQRANIGGIGGGGSGMGTGTVSAGGGASGSQSPGRVLTTVAAQSPGNKVASALSDNVRAIMSMAKAGGDAARTLSESLKRSIADQERSVDSLQRKLTGLYDTFHKLQDAKIPAPSGEFADDITELRKRRTERISSQIQEGMGELSTKQTSLDALKDAKKTLVDPKSPEKEADAGGGGMSAMMKAARAGLIVAGANRIMGAGADALDAYGNWAGARGRVEAQRGDIYGGEYRRAYSRDYTTGLTALAMEGRLKGYERYKEMGDATSNEGRAYAAQGSAALKATKSAIGVLTGGGGASGVGDYIQEGDLQAMNDQHARLAQNRANFERSSGGILFGTALQQFQSNMGRNMGLNSQLGFGGGVTGLPKGMDPRKGYDALRAGTPGVRYDDRIADLQSKLGIYSLEEYAGARGQLRQSLGDRGLGGGLTGLVMGAQANGGAFSGIGGLAGQVGIGGQAAEFLRGTMGFSNKGTGLNEAAAMGVGGAIGQGLSGGGFATSGIGALSAFQGGMGGGFTGGAGDLMMAQQAQGGMGLLRSTLGGGIDKYQASVNFVNAGRSFGHQDFATQGYLSNVFGKNPQLAMDIIQKGKSAIPEELQGLVKGPEQVKDFMRRTEVSLMNRASHRIGTGSEQGRMVRDVAQAGGFKSWLDQQGIKAGSKEARHAEKMLGGGMAIGLQGIEGVDVSAAEGYLKFEAGIGSKGLKKGSRGAVHDAAREALAEDNKAISDQLKKSADFMGTFLNAVKETKTAQDTYGQAIKDMSSSAGEVQKAFEIVAEAAMKAAIALNPDAKKDIDAYMRQFHSKNAPQKAGPSKPITTAADMPTGGAYAPSQSTIDAARKALGH